MTTAASLDEWARIIAGLVTVLGSCGGAIYLLIRYQRTFIGAQDTEIDNLRDRLDEVVRQLGEQRHAYESELDAMRAARRRCEDENAATHTQLVELRRLHDTEVGRLENELAVLRRQLAEAVEGHPPYTNGDHPGTRRDDGV